MFTEFLKSGVYLRNWSPKTVKIYERTFKSYGSEPITKASLDAWIIRMREKGLTPGGCNVYIRCMNAFCEWMFLEGKTTERLKLKLFHVNPPPVTVLEPTDIRRLMTTLPKRSSYLRVSTLCMLLLDTGLRIDEALQLTRESIDLDNLLVTVRGKGNKVRRIPFSPEMRKHLYRYMARVNRPFVFGTATGTKMSYRNARRSIGLCFKTAGVTKHVHPHLLRHTFAANYMRNNGNVYQLSRLLGHASVVTTERYLRGLQVQELKHVSPLQ